MRQQQQQNFTYILWWEYVQTSGKFDMKMRNHQKKKISCDISLSSAIRYAVSSSSSLVITWNFSSSLADSWRKSEEEKCDPFLSTPNLLPLSLEGCFSLIFFSCCGKDLDGKKCPWVATGSSIRQWQVQFTRKIQGTMFMLTKFKLNAVFVSSVWKESVLLQDLRVFRKEHE